MPRNPLADVALASWLVLFLELACIRWFPAHVVFLTFFTNTVLLACFVGMSVGCLLADRPGQLIDRTPLWLAAALGAGLLADVFGIALAARLDVGGQADPDVVFFCAEHAPASVSFLVPVEALMGVFFLLVALVMAGPGQELGRALNRCPNRAAAYTANLLGSLAGIGLFTLGSWLGAPPVAWFALAALGVGVLLARAGGGAAFPFALLAAAVAAAVPTSGVLPPARDGVRTEWSPYYRVSYSPPTGAILTNLIGHQAMESRDREATEAYGLPHLLRRDARGPDGGPAWPPFRRVLIIGAGSGNDVSRALRWTGPETTIDAVEIDPVIQSIGAADHPDKPYSDPRVTVHLNDGRNFLRRAPDAEYDLVIFALVDSLVLHSGYSNLRLESFLFTDGSMRDVRRVLKPSGVAAVYNFFRQGWIAVRLRDTLKREFGGDPVVLTDPPSDRVRADASDNGAFTIFFAGTDEVLAPLRGAFAASDNSYWLPKGRKLDPEAPARFGGDPGNAIRLCSAAVDPAPADLLPATDDWPFLYSRSPGVPGLTLRGMAVMAVLSALLWFGLGGRGLGGGGGSADAGLAARSFFLGMGFMLLETKAVVNMALLFGGTWVVNSAVFAAILLMALAGNLFAGWSKPRSLAPYYAGLFGALLLNYAVPTGAFLGLPPAAQIAGACFLAFLPVAFAGVVFAATFARAHSPDRVFGANVAGALAGGLAENLSMLLGFQALLLVALGCYAASALCGNRAARAAG